jgi:hypothetical protein
MPDALERGFAIAGRRFADKLRELLPVIISGAPSEQQNARAVLEQEALRASNAMKSAGRSWLVESVTRTVIQGQMQAARELGIRFGGPNIRLIEKLALETAPRLAAAAESTKPFLARALKEATAIRAIRESGSTKALKLLNRNVALSLQAGAIATDTPRQAAKRLLADLGLTKGDRVLFMSGRRMEASAYAETVSRTKRMEAMNLGKAEEYSANGFRYIETSSHGGVEPDDICYLLQGRVFALHDNDPLGIETLPAEYGLPPWHPNCAHVVAPWIPSLNGGRAAINQLVKAQPAFNERLTAFQAKYKK